jgi:hypothetical protein
MMFFVGGEVLLLFSWVALVVLEACPENAADISRQSHPHIPPP